MRIKSVLRVPGLQFAVISSSEPEFYGDLDFFLGGGGGKIFLISLKTTFVIKELDTTYMLCDRVHAWWLIQSRLTTLLPSLIARRRVVPQTY